MSTPRPLIVSDVSFRYNARDELAIRNISFDVAQGEFILIAGSSGCGKTTLARCINGLIPRSYKGDLTGSISLYGTDISEISMSDISQKIGTLLQDPERQIIASNVYAEVAFGPENLGLPEADIAERVEEVMKRVKIAHLAHRETFALSGGEKQKVALAGVLSMRPSILLLDEPLASLDSASAYEAVEMFRHLADEGTTIMMIEHRVEDALLALPDRLMYMADGEIRYLGPASDIPANVSYHEVKLPAEWVVQQVRQQSQAQPSLAQPLRTEPAVLAAKPAPEKKEPLVVFDDVTFAYSEGPNVLEHINLKIYPGDLIAVLGPNGAGKSTLVKHTIGLLKPSKGTVLIEGKDSRQVSVAQNARSVGYVFQSPSHMLFATSVKDELAFGPTNLGYSPDDIKKNVEESVLALNLAGLEEYSPLGLSFGQQKRTTIAAVLAMRSKILIMDEPTAGQDYANYTRFMQALCEAGEEGEKSLLTANFAATLFITHDLDLAITYANRVILIGEKRVMADGSPEEVLQDFNLLARGRVRPTSLLKLNCAWYPTTGRFLPVEHLAGYVTGNA